MQKKVSPPPKLIVTGGQGEDELISEAAAMRSYLIEQDIPPQQIVVEDVAENTYENFSYSKQLVTPPAAKSVFVTNHFHLFRSSLYARKIGLEAEGVGAPVAWYYLPNAYTREFIAILVMEKWIHAGIFRIVYSYRTRPALM
ncbi:YdcF family protein [Bacillus sp. JCM 19041]|uniref:YdcF family protein n=1 Tax=Bacillus sp. JCM 19041 TaxID=1460637 RepID=UPI00336A53F3